MDSIDQMNQFCQSSIKFWIESHIMYDNAILQYAYDHTIKNGKLEVQSISHKDFFNCIEKEISKNKISLEFVGCGIKNPHNLYIYLETENDINEYLNKFSPEYITILIDHVSSNIYLKLICKYYKDNNKPITVKLLLSMCYLHYLIVHKNEIYDIILDYKLRVMNQFLDI